MDTMDDKIKWARNLKVGDAIYTCKGKVEIIVDIIGQDSTNPYDIQVELVGGSFCSVLYCCSEV